MRRVRSVVLAVLALGSVAAAARAGHRLEPARIHEDEAATYVLETEGYASAAALAATTVHPPGGPRVRVRRGLLQYRWDPRRGFRREDRFAVLPDAPGELVVKGAVVERDGESLPVLEPLPLAVLPRADVEPRWALLGGGVLLLAAGLLLVQRTRVRQEMAAAAAAGAGEPGPVSLDAVRQARIRGDVRGFYVELHAALRAQVRALTGRPSRDPRALAAAAAGAGLPRLRAQDLRTLAQRCERVTFGGERPDPSSLSPVFQEAEALLGELAALPESTAQGERSPGTEGNPS